MSAIDRLTDDFPHGTPDGYDRGCRGRICPSTPSCLAARVRFQGDYAYRREVLAARAEAAKPKPRRGMPPRRIFTAEHVAALRDLNEQGWSDNRIAKHLGFSNSNVSRRRDEMGLPANFTGRPRKNSHTPDREGREQAHEGESHV
ncbi:hypothetical protein EDF38_1281 [Frigoribacterium sp. PhB160]|uniref:hypothetical protein n=1 Tax=Frigoribacterium sp. PhB160 TaxID=2485192 RepID=UPI000F491BFB|nr:hypothetical protein [Frigoribacterium sp. PhB160]ROS62178.1 hypothetical protein EDF38_1281 [Frigoribacterium sp. PhB160]